ncbi:MAG: T9SS type A sorting domain-containing protein, partial [Flavobacteriales bacterium]
NGTATVTVSGATAPYSYSWSPSGGTNATATGLAAGTYTVTITDDNTCQTTQSITITQPSAFSVTPSHTNVSCNGGSNGTATVTVSGATAPYSYSWSPSGGTNATATGLAAGTYTVTITDDNTCQTTQSITITQPSAFSITASQTDILCNGASTGTATVTVSGATAPYTYSWSPSGGTAATASGLSAGTYTVTITDSNMCQATQSFSLLQPLAFSITGSQTNISCNGDSTGTATVTVSGATAPYTYSWSPYGGTAATAAGLVAGTYTVTVTDSNLCQTTQNFTLTESPALAVQVSSADLSCFGANNGYAAVTVSGGVGPYTYSWTGGGATDSIGGLTAGVYTVTITDSLFCTTQANVTINEPAELTLQMWQQNISCTGNGADGMAAVTVSGGTTPYNYSWTPGAQTNDSLSNLAAGTYTVLVTDDNGCSATDSVVIDGPEQFQATQNVSICQGQSYSIGNSTYTAGGTYTDTLLTAAGCDSVVTTILTVNTVNATITNNDPTLLASAGGTDYKWMNCETGQLIGGATSQSYTATANGSYAVIITQNGCTDTSACADIVRVSLNEIPDGSVNFFPNPTRGSITVKTDGIIVKKTELMDITGKQHPVIQNGNSLDLSALQNGVYLVRITDVNGRQYTSRIVKI